MVQSRGEASVPLAERRSGGKDPLAQLLTLVSGELRCLAGRYMPDERRGHTLQPTALLHQAYLRLAGHANWLN
ncbi:MAG: ECF-type sigma factor [Bryobacteraceae bacterium]